MTEPSSPLALVGNVLVGNVLASAALGFAVARRLIGTDLLPAVLVGLGSCLPTLPVVRHLLIRQCIGAAK